MSQLGDILREARIHGGLTIKDVSDVTKIRAKYLEALEQEDYEVIPGSTFVKAYLRTYANLLGLDADAVVDEYRYLNEPRVQQQTVRSDTRADSARTPPVGPRAQKGRRSSRRGYFLVGVLAVVLVVLLAVYGSGRGEPGASLDPDSVGGLVDSTSTTGGAVTTEPIADTGDPTGEEQAGTTTTAVVATGEDFELVITVTEGSCFLVVREDNQEGAELYAGTLSAGEIQTFDGSKRYWLHVGVPDVLTVTVNGVDRSLDGGAGYYVITETAIQALQ